MGNIPRGGGGGGGLKIGVFVVGKGAMHEIYFPNFSNHTCMLMATLYSGSVPCMCSCTCMVYRFACMDREFMIKGNGMQL